MNDHRSEFHPPFRLGEWTVQPGLNRMQGPGGEIQVEPRVMQVLLQLADRGGEVCARGTLLEEVWGDAIVGEENLTRAISELRRIFGESARQPRFVETIRNHGYRLLVSPEAISEAIPEPVPEPEPEFESEPPQEVDEAAIDPVAAEPIPAVVIPPKPATASRRGMRGVDWWIALALVVAVVLGWRWLRSSDGDEFVTPHSIPQGAVPLTSFTGREWHPAPSPDGLRVAFVWAGPEGDNIDLYLKQRNSESTLRLTDAPGWAAWPDWSPDGQTLAFAQQKGERTCICTVPAIGGAVRELFELDSWIEGLDWNPAGEAIVFSALGAEGVHRLQVLDLRDLAVSTLKIDRSGAAGDYLPRYSPDGGLVAWTGTSLTGGSGVYLVPAKGGKATRLTGGMSGIQGLDWWEDGSGLVYAEEHAGRFQLWSLAVPGTGQAGRAVWIPTPGDFAWNPAVARISGDLVYEQVRVDQDVWVLRVLGEDPWRVESAPFLRSTRWESAAAVDATGQRIVFVSTRSGSPQLWVCDREGANLQRLTETNFASVTFPSWSPDGERIAAGAMLDGRSAVIVVDARGGHPRVVSSENSTEIFCSWTPAGKLLVGAAERENWRILEVDPDSAERQVLIPEGGITARMTPAGDLLYTRPGERGLWRLPADGGPADRIVDDLDSRDRHGWLLFGNRVAWVLRAGGQAFLVIQRLDNGESSILAELPGLADAGLGAAPDGSAFYFTRTRADEGDLMLLGGGDGESSAGNF